MFLCVSLNPAMDKRLRVSELRVGGVNRVSEVRPAPGGKAAHVAMVLQTLGANPTWLGFAGGSTGSDLVNGLQALSIKTQIIPTACSTRTNLEIIDGENRVTEILEPGEPLAPDEFEQLQHAIVRLLSQTRHQPRVIFSGSIPPGVPMDGYKTLIELVHQHGGRAYLDTSGEAFKQTLAAKPDFIKPNREEAESWSGQKIDNPKAAETILCSMLESGATAGAVSLGAQGLVWLSSTAKMIVASVPKLTVRSAVGSGDATLAGFAFAAHKEMDAADAVRLAAACGSANCLADAPGRARAEDIARLEQQIQVETF